MGGVNNKGDDNKGEGGTSRYLVIWHVIWGKSCETSSESGLFLKICFTNKTFMAVKAALPQFTLKKKVHDIVDKGGVVECASLKGGANDKGQENNELQVKYCNKAMENIACWCLPATLVSSDWEFNAS